LARQCARGRTRQSRTGRPTIEGDLVTRFTGVTSAYKVGDRVFHLKFGNSNVVRVDGNKLTGFHADGADGLRPGRKRLIFVRKI
jgi:hypothetical protein